MSTINTPEQINKFRNLTLRSGLKLELHGMRMSKGPKCGTIIKAEHPELKKLKGQELLEAFCAKVGIEVGRQ
jgi:hypothetical protein